MQPYTTSTIRKKFVDFFTQKNHKHINSSSLIPHGDPSIMFTNSGMVQFKDYFTGKSKPQFSRAVTYQKCLRAGGKHNDLDNVGYTARHHTFFEMLGNFSFGDYFKEDAIKFALEFLTDPKWLGIPKDKLYITIYHNDDEAYNIWMDAGIDHDKIIRIATNDNFWSMGDVGPCGPCSEIFYDHGESVGGGLPGSDDADGDRYIEIWNIVFMQYEQLPDGTRVDLPTPSIDTGMGLERIAAIMQGVHNNYEIDLFHKLITNIAKTVNITVDGGNISSFRVIADHLRACCFLIADGVLPSNEGSGYVLRRIMRRAMRHLHMLGAHCTDMAKCVGHLMAVMPEFTELARAQEVIVSAMKLEGAQFNKTIDIGLRILNEEMGKSEISGDIAFKLYDTYGFPLDLTIDIARAHAITVDVAGFDENMKRQKEMARAAWAGSGAIATDKIWNEILDNYGPTEFLGYSATSTKGKILEIIKNEDSIVVVTDKTVFYGEAGGQVGDIGTISHQNAIMNVTDTKKFCDKIYAHFGTMTQGAFAKADEVELEINTEHRSAVAANHSAAHLLHHALQATLGSHVTQRGSLVESKKLRFDFSYNKALAPEDINKIEAMVSDVILKNEQVSTSLSKLEDAITDGVMALFGEKYEDEVRVVQMSDSKELCGGTHVKQTGAIGLFKIISETSIASGIRRIEAVTGRAALAYVNQNIAIVKNLSDIFKIAPSDIVARVRTLQDENRDLNKSILNMKVSMINITQDDVIIVDSGRKIVYKIIDDFTQQELKMIADRASKSELAKTCSCIILCSVLHSKQNKTVSMFILGTSETAAGAVVDGVAKQFGLAGGGNAKFAQLSFSFERMQEIRSYLLKNL